MSTTIRRTLTHVLTSVATLVVLTGGILLTPASTGTAEALSVAQASKVIKIAASKRGTPYQYGASGPTRFDCSGYTRWVFGRAGTRLPRSSDAQYTSTRRVRASQRRVGDLVFFHNNGNVYHVGIYAGRGTIWHSPRSGERVKRERIWSASVRYGRIR